MRQIVVMEPKVTTALELSYVQLVSDACRILLLLVSRMMRFLNDEPPGEDILVQWGLD